jgi:hypothetical protein
MKEIRNVRPFSPGGSKDIDLEGLSAFSLRPAAVPADFVARVMRGLPREAGREPERAGLWRWAAALLIFSAAAGYGYSIAEQTSDLVASVTSAAAPDSETSILSSL